MTSKNISYYFIVIVLLSGVVCVNASEENKKSDSELRPMFENENDISFFKQFCDNLVSGELTSLHKYFDNKVVSRSTGKPSRYLCDISEKPLVGIMIDIENKEYPVTLNVPSGVCFLSTKPSKKRVKLLYQLLHSKYEAQKSSNKPLNQSNSNDNKQK